MIPSNHFLLLPVHRELFSEQSEFKNLFHEHFIEQIKPGVRVSFNTLFSVAIFNFIDFE